MTFFNEGKFYAAYDRSVFLAQRLLPPLKVTARYHKSVDRVVAQVGFPKESLSKFIRGLSIVQNGDLMEVMLPEGTTFDEAAYEAWKASLPVEESTKGPVPSNKEWAAVKETILKYPIESRTPLEAMAFLAELKQRLMSR